MQAIPDAGSPDGSPAAEPPDWPEPGTPLPAEEPTIELPVLTGATLAGDAPTSTPTLAAAALSLATPKPARPRVRRVPALERRSPRPARSAARATTVVGLDDLLSDRTENDWVEAEWAEIDQAPSEWAEIDQTQSEWAETGQTETGRAETGRAETGPAGDAAGPADRAGAPDGGGQPPEPGRRWLVGAGIAAVALLLTGTAVVLLSRDGEASDAAPTSWRPPVAAVAATAPHTATAALNGRTSAGFDLVDGTEQVTLRTADLGDALYRITTPAAGTGVPRVDEQDGRLRLRLGGGVQAVDIVLNAAVLWDLRLSGGAELSTIDLSAGRVGGVDLTGGASRIALTLPRPDGTLNVRMSGGVSLFDLRAAGQTPVRVRVGSGAGQVTLDGQNHAGVAPGQTFTPAGWDAAADRIDVDAAAGMTAMTVATY